MEHTCGLFHETFYTSHTQKILTHAMTKWFMYCVEYKEYVKHKVVCYFSNKLFT
jgi:hypothetical protein